MLKINIDKSIIWIIAITGILMTFQSIIYLPYLHYIAIGLYYFLFAFKCKVPSSSIRHKLLVDFLLLWTLFILFVGFFSYTSIFDILFYPYLFLPFSFVFFLSKEYKIDIQYVLKIIFICNIFYLIFSLYYLIFIFNSADYFSRISFIEYSGKTFVYSALFSVILFKINSSIEKTVSLIVVFIGLYLALLLGRRSMMFVIILSLSFSLYYNFIMRIKSKLYKISLLIFIFLIIAWIVYVFNTSNYIIFEMLKGRMDRDSRSGVVEDLYSDFNSIDYIFGRGIGGTFATPNSSLGENMAGALGTYRNGIETGYLDLILKGGLVYLLTLLLICLISIYRAFFVHKSYIHKGAALFILLFLCELLPNGTFFFTLRFYLLWFSIYLCLKKK